MFVLGDLPRCTFTEVNLRCWLLAPLPKYTCQQPHVQGRKQLCGENKIQLYYKKLYYITIQLYYKKIFGVSLNGKMHLTSDLQANSPTLTRGGGGGGLVDGIPLWVFVMLQYFEKLLPLV